MEGWFTNTYYLNFTVTLGPESSVFARIETKKDVSHAHLDYYLDEFTFRFNRRTSRHRGKRCYRLVQQAVVVDPAPYTSLVKHVRAARQGRRRRRHNR